MIINKQDIKEKIWYTLVTQDYNLEMIWCISMNQSTSLKILSSTLINSFFEWTDSDNRHLIMYLFAVNIFS